MQYIFLIYGEEAKTPEPPQDPAALAKYIEPWERYTNSLKEAGVFVGGEALEPVSTATTVAKPQGKAEPVFTDGPFAETKEQLGGYYVVDCKDLDEALGWAAKCPGVDFGKVEVRPVTVFE